MPAALALVPVAAALACAAVILTLLRHPEWLPLDQPNERSLHAAPTPRIGGLGLMAGVLLAFALLRAEPLLATLVAALAVVSFLDDRSHLPIGVRFAMHTVAAELVAGLLKGSPIVLVVLRPPLVYGPGAKGNLARLVRLVQRGIPLPLGAVRNRRSLVFVDNLADAIMRTLDHPAAAGRTYVVSDGEDVSTPDLIARLAAALGRQPRLFAVPPALLRLGGALLGRGDEVGRLIDDMVVDGSRICTELGWRPPFTVDEGLSHSVALTS